MVAGSAGGSGKCDCVAGRLFLDHDRRAKWSPAVSPFGFGRGHVYASVAAGRAKIIVPIGAMQTVGY